MRERIARAIYDVANQWIAGNFPPDWKPRPFEDLQDVEQNLHYAYADAVLLAMREPTEAMISDPMARCYNYGPYGDKEVRRIWSSMIDVARR